MGPVAKLALVVALISSGALPALSQEASQSSYSLKRAICHFAFSTITLTLNGPPPHLRGLKMSALGWYRSSDNSWFGGMTQWGYTNIYETPRNLSIEIDLPSGNRYPTAEIRQEFQSRNIELTIQLWGTTSMKVGFGEKEESVAEKMKLNLKAFDGESTKAFQARSARFVDMLLNEIPNRLHREQMDRIEQLEREQERNKPATGYESLPL